MKVALIVPKSPSTRVKHSWKKIVSFYRLTLPVLAAYTPPDVDLECFDENIESVDIQYLKRFNLVGISLLTSAATRGYEIASELKGKNVVLGGIHPTVMPAEARKYGIIAKGRGEASWPQIIRDAKDGALKEEYLGLPVTNRLPPKRSVLEDKSLYLLPSIQTSEGCPNSCSFCSIHLLYDGKFRQYDIDDVIKDVESTSGKNIVFLDDNLFANKKYAMELFERLIPLERNWASQAPLNIVFRENKDLLELAVKSGCKALYIGIDSVIEESRKEASKSVTNVWKHIDGIRKLQDYGVVVSIGIVFGFDNDDESVFDRSLEFAQKSRVNSLGTHILTAYPGTDLWNKMADEKRLFYQQHPDFYPNFWKYHDTGHPTFVPKNLSVDALQNGFDYVNKEFLSLENILHRATHSGSPFKTLLLNTIEKAGIKGKYNRQIFK